MAPSLRALFPEWGAGSARQLAPHRNPGLEIVSIVRGRLRWRIGDRVHEVGPGSVFYTFPSELHGSVDEFEPGHHWEFVVLRLAREEAPAPAFGLPAAAGRGLIGRLRRSPHRSLEGGERLRWLVAALRRELDAAPGDGLPMPATLGRALLIELDRAVRRAGSGRPSPVREDGCGRLRKRLEADYASPWSLARMSQASGLRRTRLGELFKSQTGDSPIAYLNRLRVGKAQERLRRTAETVTEIAFACGFESSQYFARTFRHFTGKTPSAYRDQWRTAATAALTPPPRRD